MIKTRLLALGLSLALICSFAGCKNKEDVKNKDVENKTSTETVESKTEDSVIGTWIVEKYEVYDGPIKRECEELCKQFYYSGSEYEFTQDKFKAVFDESLTTTYKILNDNEMEILTLANESLIYDYELTSDSLVLHSNYTGNLEPLGYCMSLYLKRK